MESLYVDTTQIGNKCVCWKSSAQRKRRHLCSIVAIRSGWKLMGRFYGQIPWNVKPICETFKIYYLMGRRLVRDVLGNHSKDRLFHLVHWLSITVSLRKTSQESINLEKSYTWIVSWIRFGIWKGDLLDADIEELETMDASEIYSKRLNAKEVIFPKQGEFIFPATDGRINFSGGDQELRTPTLIRAHPIRGRKLRRFSWRIRRVSSISSRLTSGCRWSDKSFLVHVRKLHIPPSRWT